MIKLLTNWTKAYRANPSFVPSFQPPFIFTSTHYLFIFYSSQRVISPTCPQTSQRKYSSESSWYPRCPRRCLGLRGRRPLRRPPPRPPRPPCPRSSSAFRRASGPPLPGGGPSPWSPTRWSNSGTLQQPEKRARPCEDWERKGKNRRKGDGESERKWEAVGRVVRQSGRRGLRLGPRQWRVVYFQVFYRSRKGHQFRNQARVLQQEQRSVLKCFSDKLWLFSTRKHLLSRAKCVWFISNRQTWVMSHSKFLPCHFLPKTIHIVYLKHTGVGRKGWKDRKEKQDRQRKEDKPSILLATRQIITSLNSSQKPTGRRDGEQSRDRVPPRSFWAPDHKLATARAEPAEPAEPSRFSPRQVGSPCAATQPSLAVCLRRVVQGLCQRQPGTDTGLVGPIPW